MNSGRRSQEDTTHLTESARAIAAEARTAALQGMGGAALAVEQAVQDMWEETEALDPSDPYRVLQLPRAVKDAKAKEQYEAKIKPYGEEEDAEGAALILFMRARRAYRLLSNPEFRETFDAKRVETMKQQTWCKLRYTNGLYEGGVDAASISSGMQQERCGQGITVLSSGEKYEGQYKKDQKHGVGLQFWQNGDLYLGEWTIDKMSGRGCYYYGSGAIYAGEFKAGRRHGVGRLTWPDGSVYAGQFVEGQRTGIGVMELPDMSSIHAPALFRFEGQWKAGHEDGKGTFESSSDGHYEGQFQRSCFHGWGRLELPNGDVYEGDFVHGKRDGRGQYVWANGDRYDGRLRGNQRDGRGVFLTASKGLEFTGEWQTNLPQGEGRLRIKTYEGAKIPYEYEGQWEGGRKDGNGTFTWPTGASYTGFFQSDAKHGAGMFEWPDGSSWDGGFVADLRHGAGVFRKACNDECTEATEIWEHGMRAEEETAQPNARAPNCPLPADKDRRSTMPSLPLVTEISSSVDLAGTNPADVLAAAIHVSAPPPPVGTGA